MRDASHAHVGLPEVLATASWTRPVRAWRSSLPERVAVAGDCEARRRRLCTISPPAVSLLWPLLFFINSKKVFLFNFHALLGVHGFSVGMTSQYTLPSSGVTTFPMDHIDIHRILNGSVASDCNLENFPMEIALR